MAELAVALDWDSGVTAGRDGGELDTVNAVVDWLGATTTAEVEAAAWMSKTAKTQTLTLTGTESDEVRDGLGSRDVEQKLSRLKARIVKTMLALRVGQSEEPSDGGVNHHWSR